MLSGCALRSWLRSAWDTRRCGLGYYTWFQPKDVPDDAPVMVHLHPGGEGQEYADDEEIQQELAAAGLIGVFPEGCGDGIEDWNIGANVDGIERDDVAFLTQVAIDVQQRFVNNPLWLSGSSKGGGDGLRVRLLWSALV